MKCSQLLFDVTSEVVRLYWTLTKAFYMCNNRVFILVPNYNFGSTKDFIFRLSYDLDILCSYVE